MTEKAPSPATAKKSSKFLLPWAILKPQGQGGERKLELIDTIFAWLTFLALLMPVCANEYLYLWRNRSGVKWPTHSIHADSDRATKRRRDESWSGDEFEAWLGTTGWISLLVYALLIALTGSWWACKLYKARQSDEPGRSLETLSKKRRYIPCAIGMLQLPWWAVICWVLPSYGYQPGPVIWTGCVGFVTNICWVVIRIVRRRGAKKALERGRAKGSKPESSAHAAGDRYA